MKQNNCAGGRAAPVRRLHRKGLLAAAGLLLSVFAGIFAARVSPSLATSAGATARFSQRHKAAYAAVTALQAKDPYTGRTLSTEAGLPFLFVQADKPDIYAYCVQKGMRIFDDGNNSRRAYALEDKMFRGALSERCREQLALVMLYGYPNRTAAELNAASQDDAHVATQLLLWESELGLRSADFARADDRVFNAYFSTGKYAAARAVYEAIAENIQSYLRVPTFFAQGGVLELELRYDPVTSLYSQSFADTSGSGATLEVSGKNPLALEIVRDGGSYTFQTKTPPAKAATVSIRRTDIPPCCGKSGPPLIWVDPNCGAENQLLLTGCEPREQYYTACVYAPEQLTTAAATTTAATQATTQTVAQTTTQAMTEATTAHTQTTVPPSTQATTTHATTTHATTTQATTTQATTEEKTTPPEDTTRPTTARTTVSTPKETSVAITTAYVTTALLPPTTLSPPDVPDTGAEDETIPATLLLAALGLLILSAGALLQKRRT
ncbi:MAG: thioester domain-containing protein [Oscillospiraceae bacterium]|jgi:hypothetical protein|nr:thioester domain-containing protein [Oscillospiraceae bacterium]